jgi:tungstate transport system ATP-binding protein
MTLPIPVLEVRDLKVSRGGVEVINIPAFSLYEHETMALIGPNGSGKSSFLLSLAGLLRPEFGQITFRGEPLAYGGGATVDEVLPSTCKTK